VSKNLKDCGQVIDLLQSGGPEAFLREFSRWNTSREDSCVKCHFFEGLTTDQGFVRPLNIIKPLSRGIPTICCLNSSINYCSIFKSFNSCFLQFATTVKPVYRYPSINSSKEMVLRTGKGGGTHHDDNEGYYERNHDAFSTGDLRLGEKFGDALTIYQWRTVKPMRILTGGLTSGLALDNGFSAGAA